MAVLVGGLISPQLAYANEVVLLIDIDIKPGSDPNSINSKSIGLVPVAIFSSANFDATSVDVGTNLDLSKLLQYTVVISRTLMVMD